MTVAAGTYNYIVTFYNTSLGTSFSYSDKIVVYGTGIQTKAAICIPDIIEKAPTAPSNFIAGYVDTTKDYYYVEFCWDDNSNNEDYFQIELLDISDASGSSGAGTHQIYDDYLEKLVNYPSYSSLTSSTVDAAWNTAVNWIGSSNLSVYNTSYYANVSDDGALCTNSTYTVFKLLYGKRYLARIKAVNYGGSSDYAYLDLFNTSGKTFDATSDGKYENFTPAAWIYRTPEYPDPSCWRSCPGGRRCCCPAGLRCA